MKGVLHNLSRCAISERTDPGCTQEVCLRRQRFVFKNGTHEWRHNLVRPENQTGTERGDVHSWELSNHHIGTKTTFGLTANRFGTNCSESHQSLGALKGRTLIVGGSCASIKHSPIVGCTLSLVRSDRVFLD